MFDYFNLINAKRSSVMEKWEKEYKKEQIQRIILFISVIAMIVGWSGCFICLIIKAIMNNT